MRNLIQMSLPVCTWSPICRSVIDTVLPLATLTFAMDGKQPFFGGGGGGGFGS